MTPAQQVKRGSFGAIVNVQHLTAAGAARIPAALENTYRRELRLQMGTASCAELAPGPGVAADASSAFGPLRTLGPVGIASHVGFVDLNRTTVEAATAHAVEALPTGTKDGLLVVVDGPNVRLLPLPDEPDRLSEHLAHWQGAGLLQEFAAVAGPALQAGYRVQMVFVPVPVFFDLVAAWTGPGSVATARSLYEQSTLHLGGDLDGWPETYTQPPNRQIGALRVIAGEQQDDLCDVWAVKGPALQEEERHDRRHLLFANPAAPADSTGVQQACYAAARAAGLSMHDALMQASAPTGLPLPD